MENYKQGRGKLPKELDIHELEENRQFRETKYYHDNISEEFDDNEGRSTPQCKHEW